MRLSCVSDESPGGTRRRRAYWCAPLSMLWFVPDGCVKYWCDHRVRRGYPTCPSISAFRPKQQQVWIAKWPFSYFANMFQLTELQPATKSASCQTWNCFFSSLYSAAMVISWAFRSRCRRDAEISSFCLSAPQLVPPPPQDMKVQLLLSTWTYVFTYCSISEY